MKNNNNNNTKKKVKKTETICFRHFLCCRELVLKPNPGIKVKEIAALWYNVYLCFMQFHVKLFKIIKEMPLQE